MKESKVTINTTTSDIQIKGMSNLIKQVEARSYHEYLYNYDEQRIGRVNLKVESVEFFDEEEINRVAIEWRERSIEKEEETNTDDLMQSPEYKRLNELAKKLWEEGTGCNEPIANFPEGLKAIVPTPKKERKKRMVNQKKPSVYFDNHCYSFATHTLITDDKPVPLSEGDMKLLELFLLNANKILSKEDIFKKVDMIPHKTALGSRILRLRKFGIKIENIMRRGWVLYTNKIGDAK